MNTYDDLTFTHLLQSGRKLTITFKRKKGHRPICESSFQYADLTESEKQEYLQWRATAITPAVMSLLTPEEVLANPSSTNS